MFQEFWKFVGEIYFERIRRIATYNSDQQDYQARKYLYHLVCSNLRQYRLRLGKVGERLRQIACGISKMLQNPGTSSTLACTHLDIVVKDSPSN
jgi:hypothetical protein